MIEYPEIEYPAVPLRGRAATRQPPILTRVEVATGHGMGKPTAMVAAEWADLLAFAAHDTGLRPRSTVPCACSTFPDPVNVP